MGGCLEGLSGPAADGTPNNSKAPNGHLGSGAKAAEVLHQEALHFPSENSKGVRVRRMAPGDVDAAADICFEAFRAFNVSVGLSEEFPPREVIDIPKLILAEGMAEGHAAFVAEGPDGRLLGSNAVDFRDGVAGIGPLTVSPSAQDTGAGRLLMQAVMRAAAEQDVRSVRLMQIASNLKSYSLYLSLGFDPQGTHCVYEGYCTAEAPAGFTCKPLTQDLVERCSALHNRVNGSHRTKDIASCVGGPHPTCAVFGSKGKLVAYSTGCYLNGHCVATSVEALQQLLVAQSEVIKERRGKGWPLPPLSVIVPHAYPDVQRWLVASGLRMTRQAVEMSYGPRSPAKGLYLPSLSY